MELIFALFIGAVLFKLAGLVVIGTLALIAGFFCRD
jgi:hypothetical protein